MASTPKRQPASAVPSNLSSVSHQLDEFRAIYEQELISQEEFDRLRSLLGDQVRQAPDLQATGCLPTVHPDKTLHGLAGCWRFNRRPMAGKPAISRQIESREFQAESGSAT